MSGKDISCINRSRTLDRQGELIVCVYMPKEKKTLEKAWAKASLTLVGQALATDKEIQESLAYTVALHVLCAP